MVKYLVFVGFFPMVGILLTSCNKAKAMDAERTQVMEERRIVQEETKQVEEQFRLLASQGFSSMAQVQRLTEKTTKEEDAAESKAASAMEECSAHEAALHTVRTKMDAWKGKYLN